MKTVTARNVLFHAAEDGDLESIERGLLHDCDVHALAAVSEASRHTCWTRSYREPFSRKHLRRHFTCQSAKAKPRISSLFFSCQLSSTYMPPKQDNVNQRIGGTVKRTKSLQCIIAFQHSAVVRALALATCICTVWLGVAGKVYATLLHFVY